MSSVPAPATCTSLSRGARSAMGAVSTGPMNTSASARLSSTLSSSNRLWNTNVVFGGAPPVSSER